MPHILVAVNYFKTLTKYKKNVKTRFFAKKTLKRENDGSRRRSNTADLIMLSTTPVSTAMSKPAYSTNGYGGSGGSGQGKSTSPSESFINHVALDDERSLKEMYEFGEMLGRGSFGVVWLVTHLGTGQRYACKIINKEKVSCSYCLSDFNPFTADPVKALHFAVLV